MRDASRRRVLLLPAAVWLAASGCARIPDWYAPPIQRQPLDGVQSGLRHFVNMSDPAAADYIVSDIADGVEAGSWRWARQRPTLRFRLLPAKGLKFVMDFAIADVTFEKTGPVTVSILINGNLLDRMRCESPGARHFEKRVPEEWLKAGEDTTVTAEVDKVWVAPKDGVKLGFILTRAGFLQ